jgi:hypothetical protein
MRTIKTYCKGDPFIMRLSGVGPTTAASACPFGHRITVIIPIAIRAVLTFNHSDEVTPIQECDRLQGDPLVCRLHRMFYCRRRFVASQEDSQTGQLPMQG